MAVLGASQHVVGRAGDGRAGQLREGVVVDDRAQRAGGEDVAGDRVDLGGVGGLGAEVADRPGDVVEVDVGDGQPHARLVEQAAELVADLAGALDDHVPPGQVVLLPQLLSDRVHPLEDAVGGIDGGVASTTVEDRATGDEAGLAGHQVHVRTEGADVLGGDVAAAQALDEATVGAQERLGLDALGVADDDGLAATEVEAGHGRLVAHPARQPEHVAEGVRLRGVGIEAGTAERRAERGGVDGDDGLEAGDVVVTVDDLLVFATHELERSHG